MSLHPYQRAVAALGELADRNTETGDWTDDDIDDVFTLGGCDLYVAALVAVHPDWDVVSVGEPECMCDDPDDCPSYGDGLCGCMTDHFYARTPDGTLWDIRGEHDPEAVDWGTLHPVSDTQLRCVIETWHGGLDDSDIANLAVTVAHTTSRNPC